MSSKSLVFQQEFQRAYGKRPGIEAAYAYDGMNLIIEALINGGLDRESIQKSLVKIHYEGVTGAIQFDEKGNRVGVPCLIQIKNGIPVMTGKD
jgi:ABC-type branched-subunit amino acid transport system substrate-binding protein